MDETYTLMLWSAGLTLLPCIAALVLKRWMHPWLAVLLVTLPFVALSFWIFDGDAVALALILPAVLFAMLGARGHALTKHVINEVRLDREAKRRFQRRFWRWG